ncbi:cytidine deaminase [Nocardioides sp. B-3]|uniref:cytidine deaminase n=1 Tax=Nocardioides sp. B-3 TaxID=2895565 RepID=UPI00300DE89C
MRDLDGRTYAGATVALPSLALPALEVCVAMAIASGSRGLEAAVVLSSIDEAPSLAAAWEFAGTGVPVHVGDVRGAIEKTQFT